MLLFALPSVFTLQKFVVLLALTERSHQLQAEPSELALMGIYALGGQGGGGGVCCPPPVALGGGFGVASAFSFWYRRQRSLSESITFRSRFRTVLPWDVRPLKTFWKSGTD